MNLASKLATWHGIRWICVPGWNHKETEGDRERRDGVLYDVTKRERRERERERERENTHGFIFHLSYNRATTAEAASARCRFV
jgi:hypothetical protein